jgi:hypothetical protein
MPTSGPCSKPICAVCIELPAVLTLLLFRSDSAREPSRLELEEQLLLIPGLALAGSSQDPYRAGTWKDPDGTHASCVIDLGEPALEEDHLHPPRGYAGWYPLPVSIHIPLFGPHWFCVEAVRMVEGLLRTDPEWRALDVEDIQETPDHEAAPFLWDRLRVVASWEKQRAVRNQQLTGVPVMNRGSSVSLWRYRRERSRAMHANPTIVFPEGVALHERRTSIARSAALWQDLAHPVAIPPVELLVIPGPVTRVIDAQLAANALGAGTAGMAGARMVSDPSRLASSLDQIPSRPVADFAATDDHDWAD